MAQLQFFVLKKKVGEVQATLSLEIITNITHDREIL